MALAILAEAVARIEAKLDMILGKLQFLEGTPYPQVHFIGTPCPVCKQVIDYQVDLTHNVVVRRCGCKTGKQPSAIPLVPIPGAPNASSNSGQNPDPNSPDSSGASYRSRRKGG